MARMVVASEFFAEAPLRSWCLPIQIWVYSAEDLILQVSQHHYVQVVEGPRGFSVYEHHGVFDKNFSGPVQPEVTLEMVSDAVERAEERLQLALYVSWSELLQKI